MLRFANDPDKVFQAIVAAALETMSGELDPYLPPYIPTSAEREEHEENFRDLFPGVVRLFSRETALTVLDRLSKANSDDSTLYQLTDYHWLILYEALRHYCEIHAGHQGELKVGPYRIGQLDFSDVVDHFFWDTDFLLTEDVVVALGEEGRVMAGLNAETFGLAAGLKPHPDELVLEPTDWSSDDQRPITPQGPRGRRLKAYPPARLPRWYTGPME